MFFTFWLKSESPTCPFGIGFIKSGPSNTSLWKWWVRVTSTPPQEPALILSWGRINLKIDMPWKMWNIWFLCSAMWWLSQWEGSNLGVQVFPHEQKLSKLPPCIWRIFALWMSSYSSWKLWGKEGRTTYLCSIISRSWGWGYKPSWINRSMVLQSWMSLRTTSVGKICGLQKFWAQRETHSAENFGLFENFFVIKSRFHSHFAKSMVRMGKVGRFLLLLPDLAKSCSRMLWISCSRSKRKKKIDANVKILSFPLL